MNLATKSAKLALLGAFVLQPAIWDAQAEAWSRSIPHDWPGEHVKVLGERVTSGQAELLELRRAGVRLGYVVYQIDRDFTQPEMTLIAAYSAEGRADVTGMCLPELKALAARLGCATIRFHTMRPGLVVKAQNAGFRVSEIIMRATV